MKSTTDRLFDDGNIAGKGNYCNIRFTEMCNYNDMWGRPHSDVKEYDRLNKLGQEVLYTSLEGSTSIAETKLEKGDYFFMIIYERITPFLFSDCTHFIEFNELSSEENLKRYIIFNLLQNEFSRVFPPSYNEQNQYCISSHIAEHFFLHEGVHIIQYPSIKGLEANNVAFFYNSQAQQYIAPIGIKLMKLEENPNNRNSELLVLMNGFFENDKFIWTPVDSKLSEARKNSLMEILLRK